MSSSRFWSLFRLAVANFVFLAFVLGSPAGASGKGEDEKPRMKHDPEIEEMLQEDEQPLQTYKQPLPEYKPLQLTPEQHKDLNYALLAIASDDASKAREGSLDVVQLLNSRGDLKSSGWDKVFGPKFDKFLGRKAMLDLMKNDNLLADRDIAQAFCVHLFFVTISLPGKHLLIQQSYSYLTFPLRRDILKWFNDLYPRLFVDEIRYYLSRYSKVYRYAPAPLVDSAFLIWRELLETEAKAQRALMPKKSWLQRVRARLHFQ